MESCFPWGPSLLRGLDYGSHKRNFSFSRVTNIDTECRYSSKLISVLIDVLLFYSVAAAESLQSCLTLCNSIDSSPPGSAIPGILQARTLEWVAISFSNA